VVTSVTLPPKRRKGYFSGGLSRRTFAFAIP
jgi:hypothetical protein